MNILSGRHRSPNMCGFTSERWSSRIGESLSVHRRIRKSDVHLGECFRQGLNFLIFQYFIILTPSLLLIYFKFTVFNFVNIF